MILIISADKKGLFLSLRFGVKIPFSVQVEDRSELLKNFFLTLRVNEFKLIACTQRNFEYLSLDVFIKNASFCFTANTPIIF